MYRAHSWEVLKVVSNEPYYKLACWVGHASWRINSGIVDVKDDGDCWLVYGVSGSVYACHKKSEGLTPPMKAIDRAVSEGIVTRSTMAKLRGDKDALLD